MICKYSILMISSIALISGCVTTPKFPTIGDDEAFKYESKFLAEYKPLTKQPPKETVFKWMQPLNKQKPCKVYSGVPIEYAQQEIDDGYKIFWDGACKDGYAHGLGREFVRANVRNMESIAIYKRKQEMPKYYIQTFNLDNRTEEGDINNRYFVETTINEDNFKFDIGYKYGFFGSQEKSYALMTMSSPFSDNSVYYKNYPNFSYILYDMSNNEFDRRRYKFSMAHSGKENGFGFETPKYGETVAVEQINGESVRRVVLPNSYYKKILQIKNEVKEAGQKAIEAQKYALKVKKQYMKRICKNSVSVKFIDNNEYKKICNKADYHANLKEKIEVKLAEINRQKEQKRKSINQQKLINAQVNQANAAQRQANAAQRQADAAEQANSMQSWQNLSNNSQMQQLNNNLMFMRLGL
jgi:hypothetical protein